MNFSELREKFPEKRGTLEVNEQGKGPLPDPPPVIVLRRKGVRMFPDGQRVALYHNEKLGLTFSVPYSSGSYGNPVTANEELTEGVEQLEEGVIKRLERIAQNRQMDLVKFKKGAPSRVDVTTAQAIVKLHSQLNPSNQQQVEKMINQNASGLKKIRDFAFKNLK